MNSTPSYSVQFNKLGPFIVYSLSLVYYYSCLLFCSILSRTVVRALVRMVLVYRSTLSGYNALGGHIDLWIFLCLFSVLNNKTIIKFSPLFFLGIVR